MTWRVKHPAVANRAEPPVTQMTCSVLSPAGFVVALQRKSRVIIRYFTGPERLSPFQIVLIRGVVYVEISQ